MKKLPTIQDVSKILKTINREKALRLLGALLLLTASLAPFAFPQEIHATAATGYVRLDRLGINATGTATTGGLVCLTPEAGGTAGKVLITFPGTGTAGAASFGLNTTAGNWTLGTTNIPAGASAWPGIGSNPTSVAGAVMTVASSTLTNGTQYCFTFVGATTITNPSSIGSGNTLTGTIQTQTAGSAPIDTINYAVAIVTTNADQIAVTATVPQSVTFALSANAIAFGTLTLGSVITGGTTPTVTVTTNAASGYTAWVSSANAGLKSTGLGTTITSATADLSSAKGYGMQAGSATGNATVSSPYTASGTNVGALATTYTPFMTFTGPSIAAGDSVTLTLKAKADSTVKAATDYGDTLTITAAGSF